MSLRCGCAFFLEKLAIIKCRLSLPESVARHRSFVDKKVRGIEDEIAAGRYNRYAILDGMINVYAFIDYMKYERLLSDRNARKHVPEFRPDEIMELCGFKQKVVELNETA